MQLEFFDIPSPCVGVCQADNKGYCLGCMRTREERLNWPTFNSDDKQKVIKRCTQRRKRKEGQLKIKTIAVEQNEQQQPSLLDPASKAKTQPNSKPSNDEVLDFSDFDL